MANLKDAVQTVKEILAAPSCPSLLLVTSPDQVRRRRIVRLVLDKFKGTAELIRINAANLSSAELIALRDELNSLSLFSKQRIFEISNVDELNAAGNKDLVELLQSVPPEVNVIATAKSLPAASVIRKLFTKAGQVVDVKALEGMELKRWIQKELKQQGVESWTEHAVEQIASLADSGPDEIAAMVEHISLFLDAGEKLTPTTLNALYSNSKELNEFALLDLLAEGKSWKAELLLTQLLHSGKNQFALLGLLAKSLSRSLAISWLTQRGLSQRDIREATGLAPWLFQKQLASSQRYTPDKLVNCLFATLSADAKLKNKSLGPEAVMSELAGRLTP